MNATDQLILMVFKKEPTQEFSTGEIIKRVYMEEYDPVKDAMHRKVDKEQKRDAGRKKGELHRRILYHLGKLCQEGIIRVDRVTEHGEKIFSLALDPGQYVIEKKERKIVIANPCILSMEKYHAEGIVFPFEKETLLSRANAILVNAKVIFSKECDRIFADVNDALGILEVESLLDGDAIGSAKQAIERVLINAEDAKKGLTLNIDIGKDKKARIPEFLDFVFSQDKRMDVVLRGEVGHFQKNKKVLEAALKSCQMRRKRIFVQNTSVLHAPAIIGNAGLYVFDEKEWQEEQKPDILIMAGMSMEIDMALFFKRYQSEEWARLVRQTLKSIFLAGRMQRTSYVAPLIDQKSLCRSAFVLARNYVRVHESKDPRMRKLMPELKEQCAEFCADQEYVYRACGIPLRFRVAVGRKGRMEADFVPVIRKMKDIDDPKVMNAIEGYLAMEEQNQGYDFFHVWMPPRDGDIAPDVLSLLARFEIPIVCIDFSEKRGEVALTQFF